MKAKKIIALGILSCICCYTYAHDFVVSLDGQKVYFNIISNKSHTVEITYKGSIANKQPTNYKGELTIPAQIKHNNAVYSVVGISAKAFSGAEGLTGVTMPLGLSTVGDFAFEGCTALRKIIFPGNKIKFGQGVFYKCNKIQDISIGSDWKSIDFKMFRWSDSLTVVTVPAKIEKIQNMKSLKYLEKIYVDINNTKFSSIDGVLYNKNADVLYGCPRAYNGNLKVASTTKRIIQGALIDCIGITRVDLPASLISVSFREFSRMVKLNEILFRGTTPLHTAKKETDEVFVLQVINQNVKIIVNKNAKNKFKNALVQYSGEFTELDGNIPFYIESNRMPILKNIIGVKNFIKYE